VTCAAAAAEIEVAQRRGAPVSGETCVQYLINTIDDLRRPGVEGCRYICSPPLRDGVNHELLWAYVGRGVLESVSTDHCPFTDEQKARGLENFSLVPNGLALIQHRLTKLWDEGVVAGRITRSELVDRTATTVARRFGLQGKGALLPGKDADVVVLDPAAPRPYGRATSLMNVDYDLYEGETASASVRHTFCRGTLVYDRGEILTAPGHGRFVRRSLAPPPGPTVGAR
jgi:dihydropyrimidinase